MIEGLPLPAEAVCFGLVPRLGRSKNVHFWVFFVVEAAGIACRVALCPAITWGLGSGVVDTNQPSLQGTTTY